MMAAIGTAWAQTTIDLWEVNGDITVTDGQTLTGKLAIPVSITIAPDATVTLDNVTVLGGHYDNIPCNWAGITCLGNATLILKGSNTVNGFHKDYPGIFVPGDRNHPSNNKTLTIQGSGSLIASSYGYGAGIGGGKNIDCGNIVIAGGTIIAEVSDHAAGIGAGESASCGNITILSGTVNATGGDYAAAIGSGYNSSCGDITISSGFVTTQRRVGSSGAGIGSGEHSSCGNIIITGGIVNANGSGDGAGIGSGLYSSCGNITITDGVTQVIASRGPYSNDHSIGKGWQGSCGTVTIGGVVYWDGSSFQNGGNIGATNLGNTHYYYPIPIHTLGDIPSDWTVKVHGEPVTVMPYYENAPLGYASIPVGASVELTPPDPGRVETVSLIDPLTIPLTFEAKEAGGKVSFHIANCVKGLVQYSTDGNTWKTYQSDSTITLADSADKVSFRGDNATYATWADNDAYSTFSCTADCYIYGNVMSLINKDNFATITELTRDSTFYSLFKNNAYIYNHPKKTLLLPATTLKNCCYESMFERCTNLTSAPALPAMTMAINCYFYMFFYCTRLTAAPALPATSLAENCYGGMFGYCTSLTTAPALPATFLDKFCYNMMFYQCSSLTTAPALPATTLKESCYNGMFVFCTSLATAPELPATTLADYCYYQMFHSCTSLTTAPALPATTLANNCYAWMFGYCTSLTTAPALPATTLVERCYDRMFSHCSNLNSVTCLATSGINSNNSTRDWLDGVASTGTFKKSEITNDWPTGASGIPSGWTTKDIIVTPLTLETKTAGTIVIVKPRGMKYTLNGGTKTTIWTDPTTIEVAAGDIVQFYGRGTEISSYGRLSNNNTNIAGGTADCYIYGNIMSLVDETGFAIDTTLTEKYTFRGLFKNNARLENHPTKLLVLPATTLTQYCYQNMFDSCISLTAGPVLPAEILANHCYEEMFNDCHSLTSITCSATNISAENCTTNWLGNVAPTGTFVKPETMNGWTLNSPHGIPSGWTVTNQ